MNRQHEHTSSALIAQGLQGISALPRETRRDIGLGEYSALTHAENIARLRARPSQIARTIRALINRFAPQTWGYQSQCCPA